MLSDEERQAIEAEFPHYEQKRAVCVEALKVVQKHRGWISDESLREVSEFLGMTPDELDNTATFYSLIFRRPVGRHIILVCDSASCWVMGYDNVREHLSNRLGIALGGTTQDKRFTMLPIACLGACDHAPAMMIDSDLHEDLTPEKIDAILQNYP